MQTYSAQVDLPYAPQQVFDLVADIESYPRFLPHVAAARITHRSGNTLSVDQMVRISALRLRFSTKAVLEPPVRISVVCTDSPFGSFSEQWTFAAGVHGGTCLQCRAEFAFRSDLLNRMLGGPIDRALKASVHAFETRAAQLYGHRPSAS